MTFVISAPGPKTYATVVFVLIPVVCVLAWVAIYPNHLGVVSQLVALTGAFATYDMVKSFFNWVFGFVAGATVFFVSTPLTSWGISSFLSIFG